MRARGTRWQVAVGLTSWLLAGWMNTGSGAVRQPAARAQPAPGATARIALAPYFRSLRTAAVTVGGHEYVFLFDTGGGRTLVTPDIAARIGCRPFGRDVGYRMNGEAVVFQNCEHLEATVGGFPLRLSPAAVFDLRSLLPKELPPLDGVLALDSFRGQVVTIDWRAGVVSVLAPAAVGPAVRATGMPMRVATGENGASLTVLVPVRRSQGPSLWFLLDSGNIRGTLLGRHVRQENAVPFESDTAATLQIGAAPAARHEVIVDDINYDGVLGAAFLERQVVTLDLRRAP